MEFPQKIKKQARELSAFKCCICHENPVMEIHHIDSSKGNGIENAVPLCANCHKLYGGDPKGRPYIIQSRDFWYKHIEITYNDRKEEIKKLENLESKTEKIDEKVDKISLMAPLITDMYEKFNQMYDSYKKKDYEKFAEQAYTISGNVSTVSSGMAVIESITSKQEYEIILPKNCPYCSCPITKETLGINYQCPYCNKSIFK